MLIASLAAGSGIWATHFIAILAYGPGIGVSYHVGLTVLSLVMAVAVTCGGLCVAVYIPGRRAAPAGGAVVGAGLSAMHCLGMWALELPGRVTWSLDLLLVSIVLGMLLGQRALAIAARGDSFHNTNFAALVLTLAVVSHHFTAMGGVEIVPDPARVSGSLSIAPMGLALGIASAAIAVLGMSLVASMMDRRLRDHSARTLTALNNMPHGLCMFDFKKRLVICNDGYAEMYRLPPDLLKPGTPHDDIIAHRVSSGLLAGKKDEGAVKTKLANLDALSATTKSSRVDKLADGRLIYVTRQPMAGGGWVATHEDITERQRLEKQRESLAAQETRHVSVDSAISSFRKRVEELLGTVSNNTNEMKSTATAAAGLVRTRPRNAPKRRCVNRTTLPLTSRWLRPQPNNCPHRSRRSISNCRRPLRSLATP